MEGAAAAIDLLVRNAIIALKDERSLVRGFDRDVVQLQKALERIQSYLNDAQKKSFTQDAVRTWLRDLEALAFDADNVLDEISYLHLHKKVNGMKSKKDKIVSTFSSSNHIPSRRNMALAIQKINIDFESMKKEASDLGLQSIVVNAPLVASHASFETDSFTLDPIFIGRDDVLSELVDKVAETRLQESILSILAIVGMGGMGKTTLTRKVFNHECIKAQFGSLIWVHVSQTFDPIILLKKILKELTSQFDQVESKQDILKKLQQALTDKTYLLVLDDSWNEDFSKWEGFINSMSGVTSTKGNAIIMTTRSKKVASIVRPLYEKCLQGLSDEECWSIIKAKTLENREEFERFGREIARRCKGLPLAANVVGGVLRGKSEQEWSSINENWVADGEGGENISKILKLSFDHLASPSLKKCFAYCSIFPKGKKIGKQKLIEMWMAEGFLEDVGRNDMESLGNKFFNILLHNSLIQALWRDEYGNTECCIMHDLVHDMASSVLGSSSITPLRYMFLKDVSSPMTKNVAKHLRTLYCDGDICCLNYSDLESLHVLIIKDDGATEVPNSVRKLIHLRYLDISKTRIKKLPEWIGELHHLQTLRAEAHCLTKLPSTLKYLINLRHLYIDDDAELPAEIGRLTSLQTLRFFGVGDKKGYQIEELGSLQNLNGLLKIHNLEKVRDKKEALKANILQKADLFGLRLKWDDKDRELVEGRNDESVLEGLQPHPNLKVLQIYGFKRTSFPMWTQMMAVGDGRVALNKLIEIKLIECEECEEIPRLEHLSNLKSLHLEGLKKVRFINSSFNNLTRLRLQGLEGLESLPDGLFYNNQNLSELYIMECPKLRELPDGLLTLNSLKDLFIRRCPNLESMMGNDNNPLPIGGGQSQGILNFLCIKECQGLKELPRQIVEWWAPSLKTLILRELRSVNNLPMMIDCLAKSSRLRKLSITGVPLSMTTWNVESWCLGSLRGLTIDVSKESSRVGIKENVDRILEACSKSLTLLVFKGMEDWEWLPESIQHLTNLSVLGLENLGAKEMPVWFGNLTSLKSLTLISCKRLKRLPSLHFINKLKYLSIKKCLELRFDSDWPLHSIVNDDVRRVVSKFQLKK